MDFLANHDLYWVPPIIFVVVLLIGLLIGFWTGWKTALYFFFWGFLALIVGVFTSKYVYGALGKIKINHLPNTEEYLKDNSIWITPLLLIGYLLASYSLGSTIYWFVRRPLKRYLKNAQAKGESTVGHRIIGSSIGIIAALPMTVMLTNASMFVASQEKNTGFGSFNDALVRSLTFGQNQGGSQAFSAISSIIKGISTNKDAIIEDFKKIFGQGGGTLSEDGKEAIKTILKSPIAFDLISRVILGDEVHKKEIRDALNDENINLSGINKVITDSFGEKLSASQDVKDRFFDILLNNGFIDDDSKAENIVKAIFQ